MISYVRGVLDHKEPNRAIVDASGIGYEIYVPLSTYQELPAIGSQVKLHTYHYVREDTMHLYGFLSLEEKETFELVLSVSGVGTKVALSILSFASVDEFRRSIASEDMKALTRIPGIGKKSAERMVLELKDKIGKFGIDGRVVESLSAAPANDAVAALLSLGTGQSAAEYAVYRAERLLGGEAEIADVITQALKLLAT